MPRLTLPSQDMMTPEQASVCSEVVSGPRGKVPTPMIAWIQNPELARRGQKLGEVLRFETTLEDRVVELAILLCARHWNAQRVWTSHKRYALEAGLGEDIIEAVAQQREPVFPVVREQLVFEVSRTLLAEHRLPDPLYDRAVAELGERGVVELVAILGYYGMVSLTVNAFELGKPDDASELASPEQTVGARP